MEDVEAVEVTALTREVEEEVEEDVGDEVDKETQSVLALTIREIHLKVSNG